MKRFITWFLSAVMSLSPATAANTNTASAANAADTAIVAEAEAGDTAKDRAEESDDQENPDAEAADKKDYDALMDTYASEVQDWTYLADENVWVIPVNTEAPTDKPDGEAPTDGERPELPDGEAPTDGGRPELPDGEAPTDGERPDGAPERPDGEQPADKPDAAPERPDGENADNDEAPADLPDDADEKGAPQEGDALPLMGIPGDLVLGVDTDRDGTVDVTAESYTESVTGVLIWVDGAELTELIEVESQAE